MAEADDLSKLATSVLLEELGKHRRYQDRYVQTFGATAHKAREAALLDELQRRGALTTGTLAPPEIPPRPTCRLHPLADHVVVLPEQQPDVTPGGIIRPESAKEVPMQGEVLAVGPGVVEPGIGTRVPAVSVGDQVLFGRYSGIEFTLDEQKLLIMREADVLGILT